MVIVSGICMWLNWGFGLIAAFCMAKEVARKDSHNRSPCSDVLLIPSSACGTRVVWFDSLCRSPRLRRLGCGGLHHRHEHDGFYCGDDLLPVNLVLVVLVIAACAVVMVASHPDAGAYDHCGSCSAEG